jgi:general secretion pathway protein I
MKRKQNGFTLLETLVAMIIMSTGILLVANAWSGNTMRLQKAKINNSVAFLLQKKMTEIEIYYKDKPVEEIPETDGGDFSKDGKEFSQYKWTLKTRDFEMPNLADAMSSKDGGANELLIFMISQVTEFISKVVKEVTVTIIYTGKISKREIKNSVTTYFIDYKKEMTLPNLPGLGK